MQNSKVLKSKQLYLRTPLVRSFPLSKLLGRNIYLKMDTLQRSGSFKDRGISVLLQHFNDQGITNVVSSSGGNAGIACATIANELNMKCTVIVPKTTEAISIAKMKMQNAQVHIHGENWNEADEFARNLCREPSQQTGYVHPFDHPLLWKGHASIMHEIREQWIDEFGYEQPPDAIVCSVGGGGLLNGICIGIDELGWNKKTSIITAETIGCDSFYQSFIQNKLITLDAITSIATTLGARKVQGDCLNLIKDKMCFAHTVTDAQAIQAILSFSDDHKTLVEPACAASLALLYQQNPTLQKFQNIIVQVCGGSGIHLHLLQKYCQRFGIAYP